MAKFSLILSICVAAILSVSTLAFVPGAAAPKGTALYGQTRVTISLNDGEPIENALKRFKREVNKSGHLFELRHRRHFENTQERKKRKIREAGMRRRMERMNRKRQQRNFA
mmetsp:Transcript_21682/g.32368  ORF Transcript_21682/g.32368 Transcript_21682/m.32368 type:complete len:111 (-) Transcript_21682:47-379(-)|eukprot:CAMPEP_0116005250 /NCGR_PEP_ID=MMETSP0321-20121206/1063_1 /TAXON_ID=163516 /ORGANISM="Leptocylindrus danicus var. danicus, Strain B650" /LENGTH=110 /DNA_ID=CAMNT_0003473661 /DNA_START=32 /DNA_END=364 /DNA_ORIENTATION=-